MDHNLCTRCKGRNLCGKPFCSIVSKVKQFKEVIENTDTNFTGTTPPGCFVGRTNYPKVNLNILTPSYEDKYSWTRDSPQFWYKTKFEIPDILQRRSGMIAVRSKIDIKSQHSRFLEIAQEIAQAKNQVNAEFWLKKKPRFTMFFDSRLAPIGSPAEVKKAKLSGNVKIAHPVDKTVSDTDLKAKDAIEHLYKKNIDENSITKIMSLGLLGLEKNRKLVPTRWTITAVDDTISKKLIEKVKDFNTTGNHLVFQNTYLGNHFEILVIPREWQFEVIETKFPKSVWNPNGVLPVLYSDHENYYGRKTYASSVAGAYYSTRLAALEYLSKTKSQAAVLAIREVYPEYDTPMGVWVIREAVRGAFQNRPEKFDTLESALSSMKSRLKLPFEHYKKQSKLLSVIKTQRSLMEFT
ncbi:MAG: Nre family DNA repair protein [archaeon]|nr:Nre family DNA repair protein [archaeon]